MKTVQALYMLIAVFAFSISCTKPKVEPPAGSSKSSVNSSKNPSKKGAYEDGEEAEESSNSGNTASSSSGKPGCNCNKCPCGTGGGPSGGDDTNDGSGGDDEEMGGGDDEEMGGGDEEMEENSATLKKLPKK